MDKELLTKIDAMIQDFTQELAALTINLINIKSVKSDPAPTPFGQGCKQVLDLLRNLPDK